MQKQHRERVPNSVLGQDLEALPRENDARAQSGGTLVLTN